MIVESREEYIRHLPKGLPIYFQPEFLNAVDENWTAVIEKVDGKVIYILPCNKRVKYGLTLYGPAELAHDNTPIFLDKNTSLKTIEGNLSGIYCFLINDRNNELENQDTATYNKRMRNRQLIDMRTYPTELNDVRKKTRQNIRKAINLNLVEDSNLDRFYTLYNSTFDRRKVRKWTEGRYTTIYHKLKEHFDTRIYVLEDEKGRALAANWVVGYQDTLYGIMRAKNYDIKQRGAQEYTMWSVIQIMREKYDFWDLGGSDIPGVKRFNLEMGAENIEYPLYELRRPTWLWNCIDMVKK